MERRNDDPTGLVLIALGVLGPLVVLAFVTMAMPNSFMSSRGFIVVIVCTAGVGLLTVLAGACLIAQSNGHEFTLPLKPWRWPAVMNRVQVRELPPAPPPAPQQPAGIAEESSPAPTPVPAIVPLSYHRAPRLPDKPNASVPLRVLAHMQSEKVAVIGFVMIAGSVGLLAAMSKGPTPDPTFELAARIAPFVGAAMMICGAIRVYQTFRYAVTVSARVVRILSKDTRAAAIVDYQLDGIAFNSGFALPAMDAAALEPGDRIDIIVHANRPTKLYYDLALARQLQREGASPAGSSAANEKLEFSPQLNAARARNAAIGGAIIIAFGLYQSVSLFDLEQHGGTKSVWGPIAVMYDLMGAAGTLVFFLAGGAALLVYAGVVASRRPPAP
jgi:hypothetical protein